MTCKFVAVFGACVAVGCASVARADVIMDLGGGWQATIFDEEHSDLTVDSASNQQVVLEKFANFQNLEGISIAFEQIAADAQTAPRIILTDMFIANNSGFDWTDFHEILLGDDAAFNVALSASFSIDPFTDRSYSDGNTQVTFFGGVVADGTFWTPGLDSGGLVIDIDLSDAEPAIFILKELPSIPAPGGLAALAAAAIIGRRRRRAG